MAYAIPQIAGALVQQVVLRSSMTMDEVGRKVNLLETDDASWHPFSRSLTGGVKPELGPHLGPTVHPKPGIARTKARFKSQLVEFWEPKSGPKVGVKIRSTFY